MPLSSAKTFCQIKIKVTSTKEFPPMPCLYLAPSKRQYSSTELAVLNIPYTWNHAIVNLCLWLLSLSEFQSRNQRLIPLAGQRSSAHIFTICRWACGVHHPSFDRNSTTMNILLSFQLFISISIMFEAEFSALNAFRKLYNHHYPFPRHELRTC